MDAHPNLKVLFVSHSAELFGAERSLVSLMDGLRRTGDVEVAVVLPRHGPLGEVLKSKGIESYVIRYYFWIGMKRGLKAWPGRMARMTGNLIASLRARRLVQRLKCDVIYSNSLATPFGALLSLWSRTPHIWHAREFVEEGLGARYDVGVRLAMRFIERSSARVVCNSQAVAAKMLHYIPGDKLAVLYNGFEFPGGAAVDGREAYDRRVLGRRRIRLSIVGSVQAGKGQEDGIRALAALVARGADAELYIAGSGPPAHAEQLKALAKNLGVESRVLFAGYVEDVARVFEDSAIILVPSRREAFGRVAVEAMAYGTPVIAAKSGGVPEVIDDGVTGRLYEPGDCEALADSIEELRTNAGLYGSLVDNAWHTVREKFGMHQYVVGAHDIILSSILPMKSL